MITVTVCVRSAPGLPGCDWSWMNVTACANTPFQPHLLHLLRLSKGEEDLAVTALKLGDLWEHPFIHPESLFYKKVSSSGVAGGVGCYFGGGGN